MPAPTGYQSFTYDPVDLPVVSSDPAQARPVGVGPVASGGTTLDVTVDAAFSAPVNVAISVYAAPIDDEEVYFMNEHDNLTPLSTAAVQRDRQGTSDSYSHDGEHDGGESGDSFQPIVLWKKNVTVLNQNVYGPVSVSELPSGLYVVTLTVKPVDGRGAYRWTTNFRIP
jgi:hypothetical protein